MGHGVLPGVSLLKHAIPSKLPLHPCCFLSPLLFLSKDSAFSAVSSATNLSSGSLVYEDDDSEEVD